MGVNDRPTCGLTHFGRVSIIERNSLADSENSMATVKTKSVKKRRVSARQRVEKAGPSRSALRRLVKKSPPPQSWFDETADPFKPQAK